ncbi:hypothetical protein [Halorussus litoreus]|uniref:hypothetical protein n=1 Tax=Halorussus litoreus TaxID=1710536 RepID=UPI000E266DB2|nr:hypothetical protein [Halorussus litoreus]
MERKAYLSLFEDVPALDPDAEDDEQNVVEASMEMEQDGTIEQIWARNYIGHDFDLRYQFLVKHDGNERSLIDHLGKEFLTGDDDTHDPDLREEVQEGDEIIIRVENTETEYLYHANAAVSVDYEAGLMGFIETVLDALPFGGEN